MGRVINGSQSSKTPTVHLKDKIGSTFIGLKTGQKPGKQPGALIFEFKIEGGDCSTVIATGEKNAAGKNIYAPIDVAEGDQVSIFGDTQLNDKLGQVKVGERVQVTYNGPKVNEKSGRTFNDYKVEVL